MYYPGAYNQAQASMYQMYDPNRAAQHHQQQQQLNAAAMAQYQQQQQSLQMAQQHQIQLAQQEEYRESMSRRQEQQERVEISTGGEIIASAAQLPFQQSLNITQSAPPVNTVGKVPLPIIPLSEPVTGPPTDSYIQQPINNQPVFYQQQMAGQTQFVQQPIQTQFVQAPVAAPTNFVPAQASFVQAPLVAPTTFVAQPTVTSTTFAHGSMSGSTNSFVQAPIATSFPSTNVLLTQTVAASPQLVLPQTQIRAHFSASESSLVTTEHHFHTHVHQEVDCETDRRLFRRNRKPHGVKIQIF